MNDMKNILRDIGYLGVGAAAVIIEAGAKAGKALIRKGEKTLRENQDTVDSLKRKAKDLGDKMKDAVEKASARTDAACEPDAPVDPSALTPEERAELRRQLDEADAACGADAACDCEAVCECETCECEESAERPVTPDVIYHAETPAEPESPETTPNG